MKRADEIFPGWKIHTGFAAHAAVNLRKQRRGDLDEINAAHPHTGRKSGHVADYAAAERNHITLTIKPGIHCGRQNFSM